MCGGEGGGKRERAEEKGGGERRRMRRKREWMEKEIHCRLYLWTVSKSPMTHSDLFSRKKGDGGRGGERVKGMGKGKKRE